MCHSLVRQDHWATVLTVAVVLIIATVANFCREQHENQRHNAPEQNFKISRMIAIRQANENDLAAMLEIYNDIILNTTAVWHNEIHTLEMRQEWFALKKQQGFPVFVATEEEIIVGFSTIGPFRPWEGYKFTVENSIYVAAGQRGKGIAKLLMPPLIESAKELKLHAIVAGIEASNEASIALHKKFGFEEVAHFKEVGYKFDRWLDLKFLELIV